MQSSTPSRTAEAVAIFRALDARQPAEERIVDDPYAELFLGPAARAAMLAAVAGGALGRWQPLLTDGLMPFVLARSRFMDEALMRSLRGKCEQVVLLGAGYDMRAYRFADALRGRPFFEVDHPATASRKERILTRHASRLPETERRAVVVDFERESFREALAGAGFREGRPTFFIWEGVSMYLTRSAVKETLSTLAAIGAPRSTLVLDLWHMVDDPSLVGSMRTVSVGLMALLGEAVTFGIHPEELPHFLEPLGLRLEECATAEALRANYLDPDTHMHPAAYCARALVRAKPKKRRVS